MAKEPTKQEYRDKIKELRYALALSTRKNDILQDKVDSYRKIVEELENRSDEAYKESEEIIYMLKHAADGAEYHLNQFIEKTGELRVEDAVYQMQLVYRTIQHFYDPKTNEDEE
jgi:predicted nuclease with TOPRIM domain